MERLTKTERYGLWAIVAIAALSLATVHTLRTCGKTPPPDADSANVEMERFVRQVEAFQAESIPDKKGKQKKQPENKESAEKVNPLQQKLEKK